MWAEEAGRGEEERNPLMAAVAAPHLWAEVLPLIVFLAAVAEWYQQVLSRQRCCRLLEVALSLVVLLVLLLSHQECSPWLVLLFEWQDQQDQKAEKQAHWSHFLSVLWAHQRSC